MFRNLFGTTLSSENVENGASMVTSAVTREKTSAGQSRKGGAAEQEAVAGHDSENKGGFFKLDPVNIAPGRTFNCGSSGRYRVQLPLSLHRQHGDFEHICPTSVM